MKAGCEVQRSEIQVLLHMSSGTLNKSLESLGPQFPDLFNGENHVLEAMVKG